VWGGEGEMGRSEEVKVPYLRKGRDSNSQLGGGTLAG